MMLLLLKKGNTLICMSNTYSLIIAGVRDKIRHSKSNNESQTSYVEDSARALSLDTHLTYSLYSNFNFQFVKLSIYTASDQICLHAE